MRQRKTGHLAAFVDDGKIRSRNDDADIDQGELGRYVAQRVQRRIHEIGQAHADKLEDDGGKDCDGDRRKRRLEAEALFARLRAVTAHQVHAERPHGDVPGKGDEGHAELAQLLAEQGDAQGQAHIRHV